MTHNPYTPPKSMSSDMPHTKTAYPTKKVLWLLNSISFLVLLTFFTILNFENIIQDIFHKIIAFIFASLFVMLIPNLFTCLWIRYKKYDRNISNIFIIFIICFLFSFLNFLLFSLFVDNEKFMMLNSTTSKIIRIIIPSTAYGIIFTLISLFCLPKNHQ